MSTITLMCKFLSAICNIEFFILWYSDICIEIVNSELI